MIGSLPNVRYVGECIIAELRGMSKPTYLTDVKTADWGPFDLKDEKLIEVATQGPVFFLWINSEAKGTGKIGSATPGKDWLDVEYTILGGAVNAVNVQGIVMDMATDLRRMMRSNKNRIYPGEAAGGTEYCCNTIQSGLLEYAFGLSASSMGYGMFASRWVCTVAFPFATG